MGRQGFELDTKDEKESPIKQKKKKRQGEKHSLTYSIFSVNLNRFVIRLKIY